MSGISRRSGRRLLAALLAVVAILLSACSASEPAADEKMHGAELDQKYVASPIELTDTTGQDVALGDVEKDLTLVFFGYTRCPDICGIVMSSITSAITRLDDDLRERVGMVFVTTDPARDDTKTLRGYLDRYDPSFTGLTGDLDDVVEVGRSMKVMVDEGEKLPSGGYEVVHSDHVVGLDAGGEGTIVWTKDVSASEMSEDIEALLTR
ncbi:SCO family protein [Nocardioides gilvus]|uniref:SCO family protein n=1 Tax=Nocardioides gilvus TaxID=1735589 RepID=UPI000D74B2A2|nr:SCO family protein [Nocardioides gilvus]